MMSENLLLNFISFLSGVGIPHLNPTLCETIFTENNARLLFFKGEGEKRKKIFIIYALINRFHILDLIEESSIIRFLQKNEVDVYLLDWGIPPRENSSLGMKYYIDELLFRAIRKSIIHSKIKKISLLGYCMGGTIAAIFTSIHPEFTSTLINVASPIDFKNSSKLAQWTDEKFFNVDILKSAWGNIPPVIIQSGFIFLQPFSLIKKYLKIMQNFENKDVIKKFLAVEKWSNDNIPFPGEFYREYIRDCYQRNLLINGGMKIGEKEVDLKNIECPILVISALNDSIVSKESSEIILEIVKSKKKEKLLVEGGHVGVVISEKNFERVWGKVIDFLKMEDLNEN